MSFPNLAYKRRLFLHNFASSSSAPFLILDSALESLLCINAVNYYICNFKYTIWGLNPWNSNLFFSLHIFLAFFFFTLAATRKKKHERNGNCWRNAKFVFKACFSSPSSRTKRICLDYWIVGGKKSSNMWWRLKEWSSAKSEKDREKGRKKVSQFRKFQMVFKR